MSKKTNPELTGNEALLAAVRDRLQAEQTAKDAEEGRLMAVMRQCETELRETPQRRHATASVQLRTLHTRYDADKAKLVEEAIRLTGLDALRSRLQKEDARLEHAHNYSDSIPRREQLWQRLQVCRRHTRDLETIALLEPGPRALRVQEIERFLSSYDPSQTQ